jgi:Fe-S-cluster containining protein
MAQGLRFECQPGCTECCRQPGFVYLTEEDVVRAAAFLGIPAKVFEHRYVFRTRHRRRLRTPREGRCHFLRADGCSIHPAKPTQCRIFPFWPELVESRREWKKTAGYCPGIGKGPLIQIENARDQAEEMRLAYPELY